MKSAKRLFLTLLVVNLLFVAATIGVFVYASGIAEKKSQTIAQLKADAETNEHVISDYKALETALNNNKDLEAIAEKALPATKDEPAILAEFDKFSREASFPIKKINFVSATTKSSSPTSTSVTGVNNVTAVTVATSSGTVRYDSLLEFMRKLEKNQRRMQVTSISITPNPQAPGLLDRVDLVIDIYVKSGK